MEASLYYELKLITFNILFQRVTFGQFFIENVFRTRSLGERRTLRTYVYTQVVSILFSQEGLRAISLDYL